MEEKHFCTREKKLDEMHYDIKSLNTSFQEFRLSATRDITELKTRATMWGLFSGIISSTIIAFVNFKFGK